ncbi:hypothetical protein Ga0123461_0082 [Mariprofundus aestuarium]|uniref:Probable membrane transporter protein n=1 Tax=Mariprofundus aestuarium TaxID=1921086 RepID=A0A2K8KUU7_MARES|nr:sulfite exporter TauE/SafE family protein [Mariprofundus aestuarium]ATX78535.1 hypothetical protein Ga0123461_0082 [Mariprofundus aestuarium]
MAEIELGLIVYGLIVGLGAGLIGGTLAGLAGVGGGLIYVPLFYAFMPSDSEGMAIHIFASMVAVVATAFFSARAHLRLGHVDISSMFALLPGLVIGAALGLWSTLLLPQFWILVGIAALNAWVAFDYGRTHRPHAKQAYAMQLLSGPIGYISGLFGIGGGTMLVPLLRRFVHLRQAVGTSAMCGLVMAAGAILLNLSLESDWNGLLGQHWSFLLGAWAGIIAILPFASGWSARLHDSAEEATLRFVLKTVFISLALALSVAAFLSV